VTDTFIIIVIINEVALFNTLMQLVTKACETLHSYLPKYFHYPRPVINLFTMYLKEHQYMICVNL